MVLLVALCFAMITMAWTSSLLLAATAQSRKERVTIAAREALGAAESGIHAAIARLDTGENLVELGSFDVVLRGAGAESLHVTARLWSAGNDGLDNDLDGTIDEAEEADMVEVASTGTWDRCSRTVRATLLQRFRPPSINAATYLSDPLTDVTISGDASLSGYDHAPDGTLLAGSGGTTGDAYYVDADTSYPTPVVVPAVHALGISGDPTYIQERLDSNSFPRITGLGGSPSIANLPMPIDVQQMYAEAARNADVTLVDGKNEPSGPGAWGSLESPKLFYGSGTKITLSASAGQGCGILVIDGDLEMSGSFQWRGLVIVNGSVKFSGGSDGLRLVGALVCVPKEGVLVPPKVTFSGNASVLYSAAGIQNVASGAASKFTVLNWRESESEGGTAPTVVEYQGN